MHIRDLLEQKRQYKHADPTHHTTVFILYSKRKFHEKIQFPFVLYSIWTGFLFGGLSSGWARKFIQVQVFFLPRGTELSRSTALVSHQCEGCWPTNNGAINFLIPTSNTNHRGIEFGFTQYSFTLV